MNKNAKNILRIAGVITLGTVIVGAIVSRMKKNGGCTATCCKCGSKFELACNCPKCGHSLDCTYPKCKQQDGSSNG